jgi:hypothetical protein
LHLLGSNIVNANQKAFWVIVEVLLQIKVETKQEIGLVKMTINHHNQDENVVL